MASKKIQDNYADHISNMGILSLMIYMQSHVKEKFAEDHRTLLGFTGSNDAIQCLSARERAFDKVWSRLALELEALILTGNYCQLGSIKGLTDKKIPDTVTGQ